MRRTCKPVPHKETIREAYARCKSVHIAAREFGVSGETFRKWMNSANLKRMETPWSTEEDERLRQLYKQKDEKGWSLQEIAAMLGRTRAAVAHRSSRLGVTDIHRKKPKRNKATQVELPWSRWVKNEHPRGFAGHKHTDEAKQKISEQNLRSWERMKKEGTGNMSEPARQARSEEMLKLREKLKASDTQPFSRCRGGKRPDLGDQYFRSRWEANIARYLNLLMASGEICRWEYEPDTFWFHKIKRGTRSYTPDFKVWEKKDSEPYYIEVKGWMTKQSKTRLDRMKRYYPGVRIDLIEQSRYRQIMRTAKALIPEWEGEK